MQHSVICPACTTVNAPEAIFCSNSACHKALGDFPYVRETLQARLKWHERLADRVSAFVGTPYFLLIHAIWFIIWMVVNAMSGLAFDQYPFNLLAILLGIEAIFVTGFLLINSKRQTERAELRNEIDYEVSVKTYRRLGELTTMMRSLSQRLDRIEGQSTDRRPR
jgi:uncharacterized membrane protein